MRRIKVAHEHMADNEQKTAPRAENGTAADAEQASALIPHERKVLRPAVRYAGWMLLLAAVAGLSSAVVYDRGVRRGEREGYAKGYDEALSSGKVAAQLNERAVQNLLAIMRLEDSDDETLLRIAADPAESLSWIREPAVRLEAQWQLSKALLRRGLHKQALPLLSKTFSAAPAEQLWPRRAEFVAELLQERGDLSIALGYYRYAAVRYARLGMKREQLLNGYRRLDLLASAGCPPETAEQGLDELQKEASELGENGGALLADVQIFRGVQKRRAGDEATAMQCFRSALDGREPDLRKLSPTAAISYGSALLELGRADEAQTLLEGGLRALGADPADLYYRLTALRALARLAVDAGAFPKAIAFLQQAEGAAAGRLPAEDSFWNSLCDQRGWAYFLNGSYAEARDDFMACLRTAASETETIQPLEGLGRCLMAAGHYGEAADHFRRSYELRDRHTVGAEGEKAELQYMLASAEAAAGRTAEAADAYAGCLSHMNRTEQRDAERYEDVLRSLAYASMKLERWPQAGESWKQLLALPNLKPESREEALGQLDICTRHLGSTSAEATAPGSSASAREQADGASPASGEANETPDRGSAENTPATSAPQTAAPSADTSSADTAAPRAES